MSDATNGSAGRENGTTDHSSIPQQFRLWLRHILRGRNDTTLRDTIEELIEEEGQSEGSIGADERLLLANILKLRDRTVVDAMVPRADIVGIDVGSSLHDVIRKIVSEGHSRLPVYRETLDDVVGIVHIKDIMACVAEQRDTPLKDIVREVQIVAPSMRVLDLLLEMRVSRQHMALVIDEYGGIDGLVTIEDLVEEIVGEIQDEHDEDRLPSLNERPDGTMIADARVSVEEFEEQVGRLLTDEEREEIDTLGGLVFALAGRVPARGELLRHSSGAEFEVVDADPRRIKRLRIRNLPPLGTPASAAQNGDDKSR